MGRHEAGWVPDTAPSGYQPRHGKPCAYIGSYDCRCDDPAGCVILQYPPGTFPLARHGRDDDPPRCWSCGCRWDAGCGHKCCTGEDDDHR